MKRQSILLMLLLPFIHLLAQQQLTNTGNFQIHPGTFLTLFGNLNNSGTVTDSGQSVAFSGTSAQIISGTSVTTLQNPDLNNSSGVMLEQSLIVSNALSLSSGPLNLDTNTITINNSSSSAVSRTNGYIISEHANNSSKIIWNISNNSGAHIFPFGTAAGIYIPFTLDLTSGDIGNVTLSTYPTAFDNTPYPTTPTVVTNLNNSSGVDMSAYIVDRFWQIEKNGVSGTATLTFTASSAEVGTLTSLRAQRWNSSVSGWDAQLPSQTNTATSATVPGVASFSPWALSSNGFALPITLLNFTAALNNKHVDLDWVTSSEINNDYFTVQKSNDGEMFSNLSYVEGAGNSNVTLEYTSADYFPAKGINYYRIKQTDFDERYTYSGTVAVFISENGSSVSIAPTVVSGNTVNIFLSGLCNHVADIFLSDINGKILQRQQTHIRTDSEAITYSLLPSMAYSVYFITVSSKDFQYTQKIIAGK